MDFNSTVDLIIRDLNEAREIIDDLKNYPGVPVLQVELAKSKCKNAAEVIALMKDINIMKGPSPVSPGKKTPPPSPEPVTVEPDKHISKGKPGVKEVQSGKAPEMKKERNTTADVKSSGPILADTFSDNQASLYDQMSPLKENDEVPEILKSKPVADLKDAIGVNDKFLFIREIFMGNPESYEKGVSRLNNAGTISEARDIIMSYTRNAESEATQLLFDIVKRKFPGNE